MISANRASKAARSIGRAEGVPSQVLKTLIRRASIATIQEYYVGANAEETAELLGRSREGREQASHDTWRKWLGSAEVRLSQPGKE